MPKRWEVKLPGRLSAVYLPFTGSLLLGTFRKHSDSSNRWIFVLTTSVCWWTNPLEAIRTPECDRTPQNNKVVTLFFLRGAPGQSDFKLNGISSMLSLKWRKSSAATVCWLMARRSSQCVRRCWAMVCRCWFSNHHRPSFRTLNINQAKGLQRHSWYALLAWTPRCGASCCSYFTIWVS